VDSRDDGFAPASGLEYVDFWLSPPRPRAGAVSLAFDCAPPLLFTRVDFESSVSEAPAGGVPWPPVEPVVAEPEAVVEPVEVVDVVEPVVVDGVVPVVVPVVVDPVPVVDGASVPEPSVAGSAHATPGVFATAAPMPSTTASAPTRPMY
jgi:hypothetical protein